MRNERLDRQTREHLRDLAGRTLEAYRRLNEAAARGTGDGDADPVSRAGEVLQDVLSGLPRDGRSGRGNASGNAGGNGSGNGHGSGD